MKSLLPTLTHAALIFAIHDFLKNLLRAMQLLSQISMNVNAIWSQPGQSWGGIVFRRLIQFVTSILEALSALICVNEG